MKQLLNIRFLAIIILLSLQACNDNETEVIFKDVPSVRLEQESKELSNLLQSSSEGWKATYFTDDNLLGGFTYLFKFTNDKTVEMASDFGGNDDVTSSEWSIVIGSTVKLSFTTKNKIHELSDSNNYPDVALRGQGYKGSFEFLYYGTEGDDIIFRANKNFTELRFTKAKSDDWNDLVKNKISMENIAQSPTKSVFRTLKLGNESYNFSYNPARRFASSINAQGNNVNFGIGFTPSGIVISPAINYNDQKITSFDYDVTSDKFIAKINNIEVASIEYSNTPAVPLTGYLDISKANLRYNEIQGLSSSSPAFLEFMNTFRASLANNGITLDRIYFRDMDKNLSWAQLYITSGGNSIRLWFDFNKKIENQKLFFTPTGDTNASAGLITILKPLLDIIFDTQGFYVENTGRLGNFTNGTFKFVPASNTTYKIHFYDF